MLEHIGHSTLVSLRSLIVNLAEHSLHLASFCGIDIPIAPGRGGNGPSPIGGNSGSGGNTASVTGIAIGNCPSKAGNGGKLAIIFSVTNRYACH